MFEGRWLAPIRRNVFDPLFSFKNASPLRSYWKELERTQFLPQDVLKEMQWRKLQKLLQHAAKHNAFYRERFAAAGIDADAIASVDEFRRIPVLTKRDVRLNTDGMISDGMDKSMLMHMKTGGSTGKSLDLFLTEECSELRNACARRHDRWSGWEPGEPVAAVWGNPHLPATWKERIKDSCLSPFIYLDTMGISQESVRKFAADWERVQPSLLFGHAHSIFMLCQYLRDLQIHSIVPRGIISTSMMLLPHERRFIESFLKVKVTDRYGCEEVSLIASECETHAGMHLNIEHVFVEFLTEQGTAAEAGEPGNIVVTDLLNYAMPLIRYQVEDVGVPSAKRCECGRGMPLMEKVVGRVADFIKKRDGSIVAGISLIENTLTRFNGISQMQIIQHALSEIEILLVTGEGYQHESQTGLTNYFEELLGKPLTVNVREVDTIKPSPSGKYRFTICKI